MKRGFLFAAILLLLGTSNSFAQDIFITLGNLPQCPFVNGQTKALKVTSDQLIKSKGLTCSIPSLKVDRYSCMIKTPAGDVWGPVSVKGHKLTADIIDHIIKTKGPRISVYFDEIYAEGPDGTVRTMNSLVYTYDE